MFWCSDVRVTYLEQFCKVRRMVLSFKYQNDFKTPEVIPQQVNILKSVLNFQKFQSQDSLNQNIKTNLDYCLIIHIFFTRSLFPKSKAFQNFANCRQFFLQILLNRHVFLLYAEASLERWSEVQLSLISSTELLQAFYIRTASVGFASK